MTFAALWPFLTFAGSQIGTPGPANMVLLANGAAHGFRAALPFMFGVAFGKQLIIWPLGLGLAALSESLVFDVLKWVALAYILYLAWRIAGMKLRPGEAFGPPPGFVAGLAVHPLNPKAWAMITGSFTTFIKPEDYGALTATAIVAAGLLSVQLILHPLWTGLGATIARTVAGTPKERSLMISLALMTVASVIYVLVVS